MLTLALFIANVSKKKKRRTGPREIIIANTTAITVAIEILR